MRRDEKRLKGRKRELLVRMSLFLIYLFFLIEIFFFLSKEVEGDTSSESNADVQGTARVRVMTPVTGVADGSSAPGMSPNYEIFGYLVVSLFFFD